MKFVKILASVIALSSAALADCSAPPALEKCDPCKLSAGGLNLIKQFEGYSPYPYKDTAGLWTIGFGHLMREGEDIPVPLLGKAAEDLLRKDAGFAIKGVNRLTAVPLTSNQFSALVSFTFNLGEGSYRSSTLRKRVNAERHYDVPAQLMRWVYSGGRVTPGLERRRKIEGEVYASDKSDSWLTSFLF